MTIIVKCLYLYRCFSSCFRYRIKNIQLTTVYWCCYFTSLSKVQKLYLCTFHYLLLFIHLKYFLCMYLKPSQCYTSFVTCKTMCKTREGKVCYIYPYFCSFCCFFLLGKMKKKENSGNSLTCCPFSPWISIQQVCLFFPLFTVLYLFYIECPGFLGVSQWKGQGQVCLLYLDLE